MDEQYQYKQYITNLIFIISELITSLSNIEDISYNNLKDKKLEESIKIIKTVILKGITNIKFNLVQLSKTAEWDNLNIAFFGETNAGKSTIIEALINGDGRSIGEGYKDFTKTINRIPYKNITLLDMPGIEGKEKRVINNIYKAINKSHIVFYVIGTNKELEEKTLYKIKNFLKNNVKVYSIINVRGKPSIYKKYKKDIIDNNIIKVENRIKKKFSDILGKNYADNIIINGYLAFLKGDKLIDRFKKDKNKALEIFNNKSELERFSNIESIYRVIDNISQDRKVEIIISNTYKFIKQLEIILSKILREKKKFDISIKQMSDIINQYLKDIQNIIDKNNDKISKNIDSNIKQIKVKFKKILVESIDNNESESLIKLKLKVVKQKYSKKLNNEIQQILTSMQEEIKIKIKEFNDRISLQTNFLYLKGDFNIRSIIKSLELNFKYILGEIIDTGLSVWGVIIAYTVNPIAGIISGLIAFARKIVNWFVQDPYDRKQEAKSKAIKEVDSHIKQIQTDIDIKVRSNILKLENDIKKPIKKLKHTMKGVQYISLAIDKKVTDIMRAKISLSLLLTKKFLGENINFAYIDLYLSKAIAIGDTRLRDKDYLINKFRLKNFTLYPSYKEWLQTAGEIKEESEIIIAKDEFTFRALKALVIHNGDHYWGFKKIFRRG